MDLDEGAILQNMGDEGKILPYSLVETWKNGLALANTAGAQQGGAHNIFLGDAFLRVFVQSCGHYRDHIVKGEFQVD